MWLEYTGVVAVRKKRIGRYQDATRFKKLMNITCGKNRKRAEITEANIPNQNSGKTVPSLVTAQDPVKHSLSKTACVTAIKSKLRSSEIVVYLFFKILFSIIYFNQLIILWFAELRWTALE
jgi:hypothetical protein